MKRAYYKALELTVKHNVPLQMRQRAAAQLDCFVAAQVASLT